MGQGLRRRPRHADGGRPRRAAPRPAARARRRLPGRRPRGRDGRRLRLLPARQGRRRAVDRHRDARPGRRRARRPPAPRLGHRPRDRRRRRGADARSASATGWSGCRGAGPASSSASTSPRSRTSNPQAIGVHPRRPRHHRLGRDVATSAEAQLAGDHPDRRGVHRRARPSRSRSGPSSPGYEPLPEAERRARAAALAAARSAASPRTDRPQVGHFTDSERVLDFLVPRGASARWPRSAPRCPDHFLRTKVEPLVLDLPADAPTSTTSIARLRELHEAYRADYQRLLRAPRDAGLARPMRGADPAIVLVPGVGHVLASARTSRPPGSPASSTSTRST